MRIDTNPALPDVPGSVIAGQTSGDIIDIVKSMLFENAGAERGTIPRAANKDGCFVLVQFMVAGAQLGHRDIDGAFDMSIRLFKRCSYVQQDKTGGTGEHVVQVLG